MLKTSSIISVKKFTEVLQFFNFKILSIVEKDFYLKTDYLEIFIKFLFVNGFYFPFLSIFLVIMTIVTKVFRIMIMMIMITILRLILIIMIIIMMMTIVIVNNNNNTNTNNNNNNNDILLNCSFSDNQI